MSDNKEIPAFRNEVLKIKAIGEQGGYGHMMSIASALWRKSLKDKGYPEMGAFVPTILSFIDEEGQQAAKKSILIYDEIIAGATSPEAARYHQEPVNDLYKTSPVSAAVLSFKAMEPYLMVRDDLTDEQFQEYEKLRTEYYNLVIKK